ncbi:MAG: homoserine O-acetyltransferase [Pedobacter sp.]|nr:MAG: homoserine O-acetyltransferase [Pedobacter sp.]
MINPNKYKYPKVFKLESGKKIRDLEIVYHTYGKLNSNQDNVVWVCHALTANSDVFDWWTGLFGKNNLFNPDEHFIICANILGSPYGTSNPLHINPITGNPYYLSFPQFTIKDLANVHHILAEHLKIKKINILIGGSLGGQQALELCLSNKLNIENLILLATNAVHSPWGVAFNESQRMAITSDRTFYSNHPDGGKKGLKAARSIALLSYRTAEAYNTTQAENTHEKSDQFRASSYQNYQGEKLINRFNAYSYWYLTKAMDSHNVGRGRSSISTVLKSIKAQTLVIGISNDLLFPFSEQEFLANEIPGAKLLKVESTYGHDGFLIETDKLVNGISQFLKEKIENKIVKLNFTA